MHVGYQVQIETIVGSARQKIEPRVNEMKACKYREVEKDWILRGNTHVRLEAANEI